MPEIEFTYQWEIPEVRDQESRPTCLAFACSSAHSHARAVGDWLSPEYLYYFARQCMGGVGDGATFEAVIEALRENGQPLESDWPYLPSGKFKKPDEGLYVWKSDAICCASHIEVLQKTKKSPLIIGILINDDFFQAPSSNFRIAKDDAGSARHALVGYGVGLDESGQEWLRVRNSWGHEWGDSGDAWLSIEYLSANFELGMSIL